MSLTETVYFLRKVKLENMEPGAFPASYYSG